MAGATHQTSAWIKSKQFVVVSLCMGNESGFLFPILQLEQSKETFGRETKDLFNKSPNFSINDYFLALGCSKRLCYSWDTLLEEQNNETKDLVLGHVGKL